MMKKHAKTNEFLCFNIDDSSKKFLTKLAQGTTQDTQLFQVPCLLLGGHIECLLICILILDTEIVDKYRFCAIFCLYSSFVCHQKKKYYEWT